MVTATTTTTAMCKQRPHVEQSRGKKSLGSVLLLLLLLLLLHAASPR